MLRVLTKEESEAHLKETIEYCKKKPCEMYNAMKHFKYKNDEIQKLKRELIHAEKIRLIRDKMIHRIRLALKIDSHKLEDIEKEIIKKSKDKR